MCIAGVVYNCGDISRWPLLPYPLFSSPPQRPPQQPPPNPPPPEARVKIEYFLFFPLLIGADVKVFSPIMNRYILPSSEPITLQWQYYPSHDARPRILTTATNPLIATNMRPREDEWGRLYVFPDLPVPYPPLHLNVAQFLFHERRWIVVIHKVYFPRMPDPERATPQDYRLAIENRTEEFVLFYDSAIHGLGEVDGSPITITLTPEVAFIGNSVPPEYRIQPTGSPAYCMLIRPKLCPSPGNWEDEDWGDWDE